MHQTLERANFVVQYDASRDILSLIASPPPEKQQCRQITTDVVAWVQAESGEIARIDIRAYSKKMKQGGFVLPIFATLAVPPPPTSRTFEILDTQELGGVRDVDEIGSGARSRNYLSSGI